MFVRKSFRFSMLKNRALIPQRAHGDGGWWISTRRQQRFWTLVSGELVEPFRVVTYETVQAPPATVLSQDLQFQIPTAVRLTEFFPQKVQV